MTSDMALLYPEKGDIQQIPFRVSVFQLARKYISPNNLIIVLPRGKGAIFKSATLGQRLSNRVCEGAGPNQHSAELFRQYPDMGSVVSYGNVLYVPDCMLPIPYSEPISLT